MANNDVKPPSWSERIGHTCPRCLGSGNLPHFSHIQAGVCFLCWGTGSVTTLQRDAFAEAQAAADSPEEVAYKLEVADLMRFGSVYGSYAFYLIERLRDNEHDRYRKALASLREGRDADVAAALPGWWEDFRRRRHERRMEAPPNATDE